MYDYKKDLFYQMIFNYRNNILFYKSYNNTKYTKKIFHFYHIYKIMMMIQVNKIYKILKQNFTELIFVVIVYELEKCRVKRGLIYTFKFCFVRKRGIVIVTHFIQG